MNGTAGSYDENRLPQVTDEIDQCLAQPWYRVSFPALLERRFELASSSMRCSHARFGLTLMAAIHLVLLMPDWLQGQQMFRLGLLLRIGICIPLLVMAAVRLQPRMVPWKQGLIVMAPAMLTFICDQWLARQSLPIQSERYLMGTAMGMVIGNVLVPLRIKDTLIFNAVNLTFYNAGLSGLLGPVPTPFPLQLQVVMSMLVVVSVGVRWRNEVQERHTFLLTERDRLHTQQLAWANRQLTELSYTDSLTSLPNRRFFDAALRRLWKDACMSGRPLSVLMIDLDYFKPYNDTLGHDAGDKCLRRVAQAMQFTIRMDKDLLARYGGEEFIAIIPGAAPLEATRIAERIRLAVEELQIPHPSAAGSEFVSVCIGLATATNASGISGLDAFLRAADFALYDAKSNGRNCVIAREIGSDPAAWQLPPREAISMDARQ